MRIEFTSVEAFAAQADRDRPIELMEALPEYEYPTSSPDSAQAADAVGHTSAEA
jgi:hypothetical protein